VRGAESSNFGSLGWRQGIIDIDTEISNRVLDVGMAQQDLNCPEIARRFVDQRRLGSPHRVCAILPLIETDG